MRKKKLKSKQDKNLNVSPNFYLELIDNMYVPGSSQKVKEVAIFGGECCSPLAWMLYLSQKALKSGVCDSLGILMWTDARRVVPRLDGQKVR